MGRNSRICLIGYSIKWELCPSHANLDSALSMILYLSRLKLIPIERKHFAIFDNRDYRWANELTVKTVFLTLLFNDTAYIMDSEPALDRDYADLVMIVRPDMRQYELLDILIEFKYLALGPNQLRGEQVREMTEEALRALPAVQEAFAAAERKLADYRRTLQAKYGAALDLRTYVVVALGFDRLVWRELGGE